LRGAWPSTAPAKVDPASLVPNPRCSSQLAPPESATPGPGAPAFIDSTPAASPNMAP
jgi:hypothetical protein